LKQTALALAPTEVEGWAKVAGGVLAVLGIVSAAVLRTWRWWTRRSRIRRFESKAVRYLLDAERHMLHMMVPGPSRYIETEELQRQKILIDQIRDELWVLDGHGGERDEQRRVENIVKVLTRTQAIQAKTRPQDMFKEGEDQ